MADSGQAETLSVAQIRELRMQMARMQSHPVRSLSARVTLGAPPHQVYTALLDSNAHTRLTGKTSRLVGELGGSATIAGGLFEGFVLEAVEDRHVVLALKSRIEGWPENHLSTATFMLKGTGNGIATGCELVFMHQGVPVEAADATSQFWREHYWDALDQEVTGGAPPK